MTRPSVHALLADLHKLLSSYKSSDFLDATKYAGSSAALRDALRALAREAPIQLEDKLRISKDEKARNQRKQLGNGRSSSANLLAAVRRSPYFKSTSALVEYADSIGLKLPVRAKESRDRVARRLVTLINDLPDSKKDQVIDEFFRRRNNQTQGWIEVIRNP